MNTFHASNRIPGVIERLIADFRNATNVVVVREVMVGVSSVEVPGLVGVECWRHSTGGTAFEVEIASPGLPTNEVRSIAQEPWRTAFRGTEEMVHLWRDEMGRERSDLFVPVVHPRLEASGVSRVVCWRLDRPACDCSLETLATITGLFASALALFAESPSEDEGSALVSLNGRAACLLATPGPLEPLSAEDAGRRAMLLAAIRNDLRKIEDPEGQHGELIVRAERVSLDAICLGGLEAVRRRFSAIDPETLRIHLQVALGARPAIYSGRPSFSALDRTSAETDLSELLTEEEDHPGAVEQNDRPLIFEGVALAGEKVDLRGHAGEFFQYAVPAPAKEITPAGAKIAYARLLHELGMPSEDLYPVLAQALLEETAHGVIFVGTRDRFVYAGEGKQGDWDFEVVDLTAEYEGQRPDDYSAAAAALKFGSMRLNPGSDLRMESCDRYPKAWCESVYFSIPAKGPEAYLCVAGSSALYLTDVDLKSAATLIAEWLEPSSAERNEPRREEFPVE